MAKRNDFHQVTDVINHEINGNCGQSSVEYILLLAVIMMISLSILKNPFIQRLFGNDSKVIERIIASMEYSYRNGNQKFNIRTTDTRQEYISGKHVSYTDKGDTKFFLVQKYPL